MRTSRSAGLTSLTAMMRRSGVVAVWRAKAAQVVYGHFYFYKCEARLRTQSGSGGGPVRTGVFRCLTVPPDKTRVGLEVAFPSPRLRFPELGQPI
jgi:hypothetical protein